MVRAVTVRVRVRVRVRVQVMGMDYLQVDCDSRPLEHLERRPAVPPISLARCRLWLKFVQLRLRPFLPDDLLPACHVCDDKADAAITRRTEFTERAQDSDPEGVDAFGHPRSDFAYDS